MRGTRRTVAATALAVVAVLASGCPVEPTGPTDPTGPVWTPHHAGGPAVGGATPWAIAIGTTEDWYAQLDVGFPLTAPPTVSVFPRTGPDGHSLGAPQTFTANMIGLGAGVLSEHLLLTGGDPASGSTALQFLAETGGTWSIAGSFSLESGETIRGMTDDALVTRAVGASGAEVRVYTLTRTTGSVTATLTQTLRPPAEWGPGYGTYWGSVVTLDGGLLAVHAHNDSIGVPDRVGVYQSSAGSFGLVATLERPDFGAFGIRLAIDDQPAVDRLVIGGYPTGSAEAVFAEYTSTAGGTWAAVSTIEPPAAVPGAAVGQTFGQGVALDGDVLVVTAVDEPMATPGPGGAVRVEYRPLVYRLGAGGWEYEATLSVLSSPVDTDGLNRGLMSMVVADHHIVGTNGVSLPGGCSYCFGLRFEAWRWDRTPA